MKVRTFRGKCSRCKREEVEIRDIDPKWCTECYSTYLKEWRNNHPEHKEKVLKAVRKLRSKKK